MIRILGVVKAILGIAFILLCRIAFAQSIEGNTTIDVQSGANNVVATCETGLDEMTANYYEAVVSCSVTDSNGKIIASGQMVDQSGDGLAQVVLNFSGSPGMTYTAKGSHKAEIIYVADQPDPRPGQSEEYYDEYNFSSFSEDDNTYYPDNYEWYGPGPATETMRNVLVVGGTTDSVPVAAPNTTNAVNSFNFVATGTPANGTYAWSTDTSNITLSATSGSSITVTAASVGNANLTVKYTLNGASSSIVETVSVVQPSSLSIVSDTGNQQTYACPGYNGVQRNLGYQVIDGSQLAIAYPMPFYESFSDISNTCGGKVNPDPPQSSPAPASAQGTFPDGLSLCSTACLPANSNQGPTGSCTYKTQHQWFVNGFQVLNDTLTYTCTTITP